MAGVGVDLGDHPVRGDPTGRYATARRCRLSLQLVRHLGQRRRHHLLGSDLLVNPGQCLQQGVRIVDQRRDQRVLGAGFLPVDLRLPRTAVVMPGAHRRDGLAAPGYHPPDPADRQNQLGDGVLGGHRVSQNRGIHRPPTPTSHHPGLCDHRAYRVVDPLRPLRFRQSLRQYTSVDGSNPLSSNAIPVATFHRRSHRTASAVSRSDRSCNVCNTRTEAITDAGIDGRPLPEVNMADHRLDLFGDGELEDPGGSFGGAGQYVRVFGLCRVRSGRIGSCWTRSLLSQLTPTPPRRHADYSAASQMPRC